MSNLGESASAIVNLTADATLTDWGQTVLVDTTAGDVVVTLPSNTGKAGRMIEVKKTSSDANTVTVEGLVLSLEDQAVSFRSDGTAAQVIQSPAPAPVKEPLVVTASTGVDIDPDLDANVDFLVTISSGSTGDINFTNPIGTVNNVETITVAVLNSDGSGDRNLVFGASYIGYDGNALGTVAISSLKNYRILKFEKMGAAYRLSSDSESSTEEGLRGVPVANNAELTGLTARDYERRKVLADGKEYVFELGAVSGTLADDGATGFWQEQVAGALESTKIDSNAGATTETLTASTNAGIVRLFTNIDVTNTATLAVQAGETLNGATDGTFLFSNYPVGTQFRADEVTGGWAVSVVGTPSNSQLSHLLAIRSADIVIDTLDVGDAIPFNIEVSKIGSNISFDPLTGIFTLKAGGTYRLSADLSFTADGAEIEDTYQFYNVNTSSFIGARGHFKDFAGDSSPKPSNPVAVISPTIDTQIILSATGNVDNNTGSLQEHSWMEVMEIPSSEVVLAGMVTPEPLAYYLARWDTSQVFNVHPSVVLTPSQTTSIVDNNDKTWTVDGGLFEIEWNPALDQAASASEHWITVDGVNAGVPGNIMTADQPNPDSRGVARVIVDATGGPKVISYTLATSALNVSNQAFISIKQLPSSTVVMPDALEVETTNHLLARTSGDTGISQGYDVGFQGVLASFGGITIGGANSEEITVPAGRYKIRFVPSVANASNPNNAIEFEFVNSLGVPLSNQNRNAAIQVDGALSVAPQNELIMFKDFISDFTFKVQVSNLTGTIDIFAESTLEITQLPSYQVINTTDTPVNDQVTSGYMDIGTMRMQWGTVSVSGGATAVTYPVPFAASPVVTASPQNGSDTFSSVFSITTTGFSTNSRNFNGTLAAQTVGWQAIGIRP